MGLFDNTSTYGLCGLFDDIKEAVSGGIDYVAENPVKVIATVAVTAATGGAAFCFAPAIAATAGAAGLLGTASTGTAIGTLSGAALTNASLAALGGGALSAGGLGMAGGTVAVATTGAVAGGTATAILTPSKASDS
jgi:hypothetical protein